MQGRLNDVQEGEKCIKKFENGSVYKGPMKNGKMHGMGEFKDTTDGSLHKGMFVNGKKEGPGVSLQSDKVSKFVG